MKIEKISIDEYRKLTGANSNSKYRNKRTLYNGVTYDSKKEAEFAQELDNRVKGFDIKSWTRQISIPLVVNSTKICDYRIDFIITNFDGKEEYIEVKGKWTPEAILKRKLFRALYPEKKYIVIDR